MARGGILGELWAFMKVRKKWWLLPIIVVLLLGAVIWGVRTSNKPAAEVG